MLILMLMSGLFTPVSSMPEWAQVITYFNPLKYFMEGMRMVYLKGSSLLELLPEIGVLLLFALGFNIKNSSYPYWLEKSCFYYCFHPLG